MKRIEKKQIAPEQILPEQTSPEQKLPIEKTVKERKPIGFDKKGAPLYNTPSKISPKAPMLPPFESRKDRVGRYFKEYIKDYIFDEFSPSYLKKTGNPDRMKGISIPLRKEDYKEFAGGEGLKLPQIAENMICVMGIDPKFRMNPHYIEFMNNAFGPKILEGILKQGRDYAEDGKMDEAIIRFRGILILKPDYKDAMYSYARACREKYLSATDEELIGRFKAESIEYFELLTELYPRYAEAYYFLGYGYLNMGLYQKADLVWAEYMKKSNNPKDRKEIRERRKQLVQPITIEKGCNCVLSGRFAEGIGILEPFVETSFKTWWPLSYYLGVANARLGQNKQAFIHLKRAVNLNPSHVETMKERADLYALTKDKENEMKYRKKAELVLKNQQEEPENEPSETGNEEN